MKIFTAREIREKNENKTLKIFLFSILSCVSREKINNMAFTENNGTKIFWTEQGAGEPLLLIAGLGAPHRAWRRIAPLLAKKYRVITFDNRGTGATEFPASELFTIPLMATDAKAVLDSAGIKSAHILGMSMGGMIAQEFALQFPEMTRSLILTVTNCGGRNSIPAAPEVYFALQGGGSTTPEEAFWAMAKFIYDANTPREMLEEDIDSRNGEFTKPENFMRQMHAIISWQGSFDRLEQINAPTLVLHGKTDQLIPSENSKIIADQIQNAKLVELENSSHIFTTDQTEKSAEAILDFLEEN